MVTNVTSFGRSGLSDWVIQRVSAVILAAYFVFLVFWMATSDLQYEQWKALFDGNAMRIFSLLALLSLVGHAWVGIWTISTDYLTPMALGKSATAVRFLFQCVCAVITFAYLVWGIQILWGI